MVNIYTMNRYTCLPGFMYNNNVPEKAAPLNDNLQQATEKAIPEFTIPCT